MCVTISFYTRNRDNDFGNVLRRVSFNPGLVILVPATPDVQEFEGLWDFCIREPSEVAGPPMPRPSRQIMGISVRQNLMLV